MSEIEYEKRTVSLMIELYCCKSERNLSLCPSCRELRDYALSRLDRCPFGERKGRCRDCTIHCYSPQMAQRIRTVMRFAGPRMILYHPLDALRHLMPANKRWLKKYR